MLDSLYGNLLGEQAKKPGNEPKGDDMFAEPKGAAKAPPPKPEVVEKPPVAPLQAFSASKLMMPPVRKKADGPVKRPAVALDLQKLQEEKESLLRQRDAANQATPASASTAAANTSTEEVTSNSLSTALYGSPDEEYDPAKPNDYDEFCRRRMRLKAEEEMEKRRQDALARQQKKAEPEPPKEDDFATKMLKKMGWKAGQGLGKDGQGMQAPLVMQKTDAAVGKIVEGQQKRPAQAAPAGQPEAKKPDGAFNRAPTRVLLLNNMVGPGEVDEDLEEETADEAGKYGKLIKCIVKEIKGLPDTEAVRIFLEFERVEDATKAMVDMNGRYFGGRTVRARFYDVERWEKGDLEKKDGE